MKDGLLPIVAVVGAVSAALLWSMSVQDPYWRLFETEDALAFEQDNEPDVTFANATFADVPSEFGNADTGSMSPTNDLLIGATPRYASPDTSALYPVDAGDPAFPAPLIALAPQDEPASPTDSGIDLKIAYEPPRAATLARVGLGSNIAAHDPNSSEFVVAYAPTTLPAAIALRDRADGGTAVAASGDMLDPFIAPAPPVQPRIAASKSTEEALTLKRSQRVNVQRRLALAGFNPRGLDGTFGPRTRAAITDFQTAWGFPATGYLEASLIADLNQRTEDAYQAWRRQAASAPTAAAPELAPAAHERQLASAKGNGRCARDANGRIIERQSLACDLAGFGEKFISLGRNSLDNEDDETAGGNSVASQDIGSAGIER